MHGASLGAREYPQTPPFEWLCSQVVYRCSVGVQSVLIEMQKALEKGEVPEEELRALESDVTGKVGISVENLGDSANGNGHWLGLVG
jgi:hypothetical protein